jgi:hypothetical protein
MQMAVNILHLPPSFIKSNKVSLSAKHYILLCATHTHTHTLASVWREKRKFVIQIKEGSEIEPDPEIRRKFVGEFQACTTRFPLQPTAFWRGKKTNVSFPHPCRKEQASSWQQVGTLTPHELVQVYGLQAVHYGIKGMTEIQHKLYVWSFA